MLPFHRPITVTLAPSDEPDHPADLGSGAAAIPSAVTARDIDWLTVADAGGRVVLRFDTSARVVGGRGATSAS